MTESKIRPWIINALVAAMYIVLSVGPAAFNLASGAIQFRVSEGLNHLAVFNRKYVWGIVAGVILFDAFGPGASLLNVLFGGGQSLLSLLVLTWIAPKLKTVGQRMVLNVLLFTVSMFMIALMITLMSSGVAFWPTYLTTALSEFIIMAITAPIMYALDRVLHFSDRMQASTR
ncbi:QueT transporter family protein [Lactiplantibacillus modestisalitolerans]|uniref:QueT transporter family protein n=1 Tax=Lactiplantibacillus modestisalitolerans TaxID=1457219 RepID=A0ABV5WWY1_9LACO|nr:QueT transporter family protein [Lactiplantibacillus modestisalitolerans]